MKLNHLFKTVQFLHLYGAGLVRDQRVGRQIVVST